MSGSIPNVPSLSTLSMLGNVYSHTSHYYGTARTYVSWVDKKVLIVTQDLPPTLAFTTYHLWKAAPYILSFAFLPTSLCVIGIVGLVFFKVMTAPPGTIAKLASVEAGVGFSGVLLGTKSLLVGLITRNPTALIKGIFLTVCGAGFLWHSGFVNKAINYQGVQPQVVKS